MQFFIFSARPLAIIIVSLSNLMSVTQQPYEDYFKIRTFHAPNSMQIQSHVGSFCIEVDAGKVGRLNWAQG